MVVRRVLLQSLIRNSANMSCFQRPLDHCNACHFVLPDNSRIAKPCHIVRNAKNDDTLVVKPLPRQAICESRTKLRIAHHQNLQPLVAASGLIELVPSTKPLQITTKGNRKLQLTPFEHPEQPIGGPSRGLVPRRNACTRSGTDNGQCCGRQRWTDLEGRGSEENPLAPFPIPPQQTPHLAPCLALQPAHCNGQQAFTVTPKPDLTTTPT